MRPRLLPQAPLWAPAAPLSRPHTGESAANTRRGQWALDSDSVTPGNKEVGAGENPPPGGLCHRAPGVPAAEKRRHLRRCAVDACVPQARGCPALHIHLPGAQRARPVPSPGGAELPRAAPAQALPAVRDTPRTSEGAGAAGAARAGSAAGRGRVGRGGRGRRDCRVAGRVRRPGGSWERQEPAGDGGRADPCGDRKPRERARERRVPAALTEPGRRGGGGRCAAFSRGPLPWPPGLRSSLAGAAALTAAWPPWRGGGACYPRLTDALAATAPAGGAAARACAVGRPCRGRAGLRVRSRPPCGYAARTWPLGSPRLRTACASAYVRQGARSGGSRAGGGGGLSGMTAHVRFRAVKGFTPGNSTLAVFPFPLTHCLTLGSRHSWHRGKRFFASGQALGLDRRREGSEEPSGIQPLGPASSLQEKAGCHGMSGVALS
ncbi:collagen alpha-1(I) chain-like [Cebus imitator]|uniref:collagen alpha-1(I) chain-like n=1 Tax=Cebus imitator TaxID=2715852 RepID=UPI00189A3269|nr:collagen alpha-1(I) chain-like [Cebus imitator]